MQNDLAVLSPEKTIITYRLSSIGSRIVAHIVDLMIILAVMFAGTSLLKSIIERFFPEFANFIVALISTFGMFAYFILFEGLWNGQTIGKKVAGIRVRMADGLPITFAAAIGRNLLRPADLFPGTYFMGLLAMFCSPKSQRFGDLVANTVVIHEKRAIPYFTPAPHSAGIHALEGQIGDLRGMTNEEYNALRRFADRFPELPTTVQNKLVKEVFQPIATRRGIPSISNVHPLYLAEAAVMKYGRENGLL